MVVNYLDSPFATVVWFSAGLAVMWLWLRFEPFTKKHQAIAFCVDVVFSIEAATIPLTMLVQAPWMQPILGNLWYNFVMTRVSTNPTTAHVTTYVALILSYFVFQRAFYSNWRSFLTIALLVFTHEGVWFLFAIPLKLMYGYLADVNYMTILGMAALTYHIKYKLNLKYTIYLVLPVIAYNAAWLLVGFPITVRSYPGSGNQLYPTELWGDLTANTIEVFSWLYTIAFAAVWAYAVRDSGPRPPKLKFVIKARW